MHLGFLFGDGRVAHRHGDAADGGVFIALGLDVVQHLRGAPVPWTLMQLNDLSSCFLPTRKSTSSFKGFFGVERFTYPKS